MYSKEYSFQLYKDQSASINNHYNYFVNSCPDLVDIQDGDTVVIYNRGISSENQKCYLTFFLFDNSFDKVIISGFDNNYKSKKTENYSKISLSSSVKKNSKDNDSFRNLGSLSNNYKKGDFQLNNNISYSVERNKVKKNERFSISQELNYSWFNSILGEMTTHDGVGFNGVSFHGTKNGIKYDGYRFDVANSIESSTIYEKPNSLKLSEFSSGYRNEKIKFDIYSTRLLNLEKATTSFLDYGFFNAKVSMIETKDNEKITPYSLGLRKGFNYSLSKDLEFNYASVTYSNNNEEKRFESFGDILEFSKLETMSSFSYKVNDKKIKINTSYDESIVSNSKYNGYSASAEYGVNNNVTTKVSQSVSKNIDSYSWSREFKIFYNRNFISSWAAFSSNSENERQYSLYSKIEFLNKKIWVDLLSSFKETEITSDNITSSAGYKYSDDFSVAFSGRVKNLFFNDNFFRYSIGNSIRYKNFSINNNYNYSKRSDYKDFFSSITFDFYIDKVPGYFENLFNHRSIQVFTYIDNNTNGMFDSGDSICSKCNVSLFDSGKSEIKETDSNGNVVFNGVSSSNKISIVLDSIEQKLDSNFTILKEPVSIDNSNKDQKVSLPVVIARQVDIKLKDSDGKEISSSSFFIDCAGQKFPIITGFANIPVEYNRCSIKINPALSDINLDENDFLKLLDGIQISVLKKNIIKLNVFSEFVINFFSENNKKINEKLYVKHYGILSDGHISIKNPKYSESLDFSNVANKYNCGLINLNFVDFNKYLKKTFNLKCFLLK